MNDSTLEPQISRIKIVNPFCNESGKSYNAEIIDLGGTSLAITKFNQFSGNNNIVFLGGEFKREE